MGKYRVVLLNVGNMPICYVTFEAADGAMAEDKGAAIYEEFVAMGYEAVRFRVEERER